MSEFFDFGNPPRDDTPVMIRATRPMLILRHGEHLPRHIAAGELAAVPRWILRGIASEDYELAEP